MIQTFSPVFRYLWIKATPDKRKWELGLPLIAACLTIPLSVSMGLDISEPNGLVVHGGGLLRLLAGIYIASLGVVVATNHSYFPKVDKAAATLNGKPLTLKSVLGALFGYLATMALGVYIFGMFGVLLLPLVPDPSVKGWLNGIFLFFYVGLFSHILICTITGLGFLSSEMIAEELDD